MRRRAYLGSLTAGATAGLAGCGGVLPIGESSSQSGPPSLSVDGRWIVDPSDNHVVLRGLNVVDPWWGSEYEGVRGIGHSESIDLATDPERGWHTNVLRVPVRPSTLQEVDIETVLSEHVDPIVDRMRERDVYVIVDYHVVDRYDTRERDRRVRDFWRRAAPRYAEEPHVLFDLYAEPTQPTGEGLDSWKTWRETAQPWVDFVKERAPDRPILVGSPQWTSMTRYAPEAPFEGDDLIYACHVFPSWDRESWEPNFGDPALEVPVFMSEWGYVNAQGDAYDPHMIGTTSGWGEPFREWLDSHENVSWCAWIFDSEWTPNMFDHEWNLLGGDDYMGEFTQQWLADRKDDHVPGRDPEATDGPTRTGEGSPPAAPGNLHVVRATPRSVELAWDEPTDSDGDDVVQYRVEFGDASPRIVAGTDEFVVLDAVEAGASYEATVVAVDEYGLASEPSEALVVDVPTVGEPFLSLPRAGTAPEIDGAVDDVWETTTAHPVDTDAWGNAADFDFGGEWRGCWDSAALYVLVDVEDDDPHVDSDGIWQNDHVEVYLDLDNSRGTSYDGENDFQLLVERGADAVSAGSNSVSEVGQIQVATTETDGGWRVEMAVPWESYDVDPTVGHALGFDVHVNEDDDGGERDSKLTWWDAEDQAYANPSNFGTVELGE